MQIGIAVSLVILGFLTGVTVTTVLNLEEELQEEEKEKFNKNQRQMCYRTCTAGQCPGMCEKCAWGRQYK